MDRLTDNDFEKLKKVKEEYDFISYNLGMMEVELYGINIRKKELTDKLEDLMRQESELHKHLRKVYGDVEINLKNGEISKI